MCKEYLFIREEALKLIFEYYRKKGYSKEHCCKWTDYLEDVEIERIVSIIMEENRYDGKENHSLLQGVAASSEGSI